MKISLKFTPLLLASAFLVACGGGGSSSSSTATPNVVATPTTTPTTVTPPTTSSPEPVLISDIEFTQAATATGTKPLLLDIYQPDGTCDANRPTVLYVHGGAFVTGDKVSSTITRFAEAINDKGLNFVSIQYRLLGDIPVLSDTFQTIADEFLPLTPITDRILLDAAVAATEDTVTALEWMQANADEYCLDLSNYGLWGESAGSITVLQVAYGLNEFGITRPEPKVVVDYAGDLFRDTDIEFRDAPLFILHGNADDIVPYDGALELEAQADAVGVPFAFYTLEGGGHGFDIFTIQANGASLFDQTVTFIEAHLVGGLPNYVSVTIPE